MQKFDSLRYYTKIIQTSAKVECWDRISIFFVYIYFFLYKNTKVWLFEILY